MSVIAHYTKGIKQGSFAARNTWLQFPCQPLPKLVTLEKSLHLAKSIVFAPKGFGWCWMWSTDLYPSIQIKIRVKTEQVMQFSPVSMVSLLQTEILGSYLLCHLTICEIWTSRKKHSGLRITEVHCYAKLRGEQPQEVGRSTSSWGHSTELCSLAVKPQCLEYGSPGI